MTTTVRSLMRNLTPRREAPTPQCFPVFGPARVVTPVAPTPPTPPPLGAQPTPAAPATSSAGPATPLSPPASPINPEAVAKAEACPVTKEFVLAGNAIFTVEVSDAKVKAGLQPHYTFKVVRKDLPASGRWPASTRYFVSLLTGPENTSDYTYVGTLEPDAGTVRKTFNSAYPEDSTVFTLIRRVLARVWAADLAPVFAAGFNIHHAGRCARCGRLLTTPESCKLGWGPECLKRG